jgi:CheY-like chemotaxis protein
VGTTFHFSIPIQEPETSGEPTETGDGQWHSKLVETCLVVHDDPAAVRVFARYIDGYRVVGLPDATEVVALTEELHPRAIVTTPDMAESIEEKLSHLPHDVPIISCRLPSVRGHLDAEMAQPPAGLAMRASQETAATRNEVHSATVAPFPMVVGYLIKPVVPESLMAIMGKLEREPETTVLLVEDEPDAARLLERMLLSMPRPYRILKARDGIQALEVMANETPDVVLLDLLMPEMDGWQTMAHMQADARLRRVPVIIVSAQDTTQANWVISAPLQVRHRRPIDVARGAECLRALMNALAPHYALPSATAQAEPDNGHA